MFSDNLKCYFSKISSLQILEDQHACSSGLCRHAEMDEQHCCYDCHLQRHQDGLLALPLPYLVCSCISSYRSMYIVYLPTRYGVYMFISPVLLLPLLASSYAEVNYEGVRVIQVTFWMFLDVLDINVHSRAFCQQRKGSICSNTCMAIPSR